MLWSRLHVRKGICTLGSQMHGSMHELGIVQFQKISIFPPQKVLEFLGGVRVSLRTVANAQEHQAVLRKLHNLFRYNSHKSLITSRFRSPIQWTISRLFFLITVVRHTLIPRQWWYKEWLIGSIFCIEITKTSHNANNLSYNKMSRNTTKISWQNKKLKKYMKLKCNFQSSGGGGSMTCYHKLTTNTPNCDYQ